MECKIRCYVTIPDYERLFIFSFFHFSSCDAYTPYGNLSPLGVASDATGQLNVALSGATEESALSEDGKEGAITFHHISSFAICGASLFKSGSCI
jgi:hypothetical protein